MKLSFFVVAVVFACACTKAGDTQGPAAGSAPAIGSSAGSAIVAGSNAGSAMAGSAVTVTPAEKPLAVGDRVAAQWTDGRWYNGRIAAVRADGTYDINYNDGDKSKALPGSKVRRAGSAPASTGQSHSNSDAPCPGPGLTRRCDGHCVNIQEDNNNCGSCGNRCPSGKTCDGHMFCRDAAGNL